MIKLPKITRKRVLVATAIALLGVPGLLLLLYGGLHLIRPARTDTQEVLFQGISYKRIARETPRPLMIHVVTVDLTAPGIKMLVTPGKPNGKNEIVARTTSEFVKEFNLQLAINGSFFYPCYQHGPIDYYPYSGDPVNVLGQSISNGSIYSPTDKGWAVLCIGANNRAQISQENCQKDTNQAIAGREIFIENGKPVILGNISDKNELFPRTAVAIDDRGEKMWLIIVDGRQHLYSEGVTMSELTDIVMEFGAHKALNLDGGGSTTLAAAGFGGPYSLNSPFHTRIPMRQRPIANHLGFYALPKN